MVKRSKLILVTVLAGSMGLTVLGIARAQSADSNSAAVTPVDSAITTSTSTAAPSMIGPEMGHLARLQQEAQLFNMTVDDLIKAVESGKPMYQIAAEHGVTYDQVKAKALSNLKTRLDDMVKVGYLTQTEAGAAYQQAQNNPTLGLGFGHGGWMH